MAHEVFISYSEKDKSVADVLCATLEARGLRCWMAHRDSLPGESLIKVITDAIGAAQVMVLVLSAHANDSPQVLEELKWAVFQRMPIIPFRIEEVGPSRDMEYFLSNLHCLDALTPRLEDHCLILAEIIKEVLSKSGDGKIIDPASSETAQASRLSLELPWEEFQNLFKKVHLSIRESGRSEIYGNVLEAIFAKGRSAWDQHDVGRLQEASADLEHFFRGIAGGTAASSPPDSSTELPPWPVLKYMVLDEVHALQEVLGGLARSADDRDSMFKEQYDRWENDIQRLAAEITEIPDDPPGKPELTRFMSRFHEFLQIKEALSGRPVFKEPFRETTGSDPRPGIGGDFIHPSEPASDPFLLAIEMADDNPAAALRELEKLPEESRSNAEVLRLQAACLFRLGLQAWNVRDAKDEGIKHLELATRLDPNNTHFRDQLEMARNIREFEEAEKLYHKNRFAEALEKASRLSTASNFRDNVLLLSINCCIRLGEGACKLGNLWEARAYFRQALDLAPGDTKIAEVIRGLELAYETVGVSPGDGEKGASYRLERTNYPTTSASKEKKAAGWWGRFFGRWSRSKPTVDRDAGMDTTMKSAPASGPRASPKRGDPTFPGGRLDRIHFSVTAPPTVPPGSPFIIDVWAHLAHQRTEVIQHARESLGGDDIRIKSKGPVEVARGAILHVRLEVEGLVIDEPEDTILWEGLIGNASFPVMVPKDAQPGHRRGLATIFANGFRTTRINFIIEVGRVAAAIDQLPIKEDWHKKAFASYSSNDRTEVLARVHGMLKAKPNLEIFLDVLSLRSGQNWEKELLTAIPASDVFYLFWSENAQKSRWVEKEWRCALTTRGLDFIDPFPLVSPDVVPPPDELASLHFHDKIIAFMGGRRANR
jgi:tetratricopeptide (TPR) repeat protein